MYLFTLVSVLFCLALKTQNVHWSITGPSFLEVHRLLGDQYEELRKYGDTFAEHLRILGEERLPTISDIANADVEPFKLLPWLDMIHSLADDFDSLAEEVNMMLEDLRGISNDLDELHKYLTKLAWFLKSYHE